MNYKEKKHFKCKLQRMIIPWMVLLLFGLVQNVYAQDGPKKLLLAKPTDIQVCPVATVKLALPNCITSRTLTPLI